MRVSAGSAGPLVHARGTAVAREHARLLSRARVLVERPTIGASRSSNQPAAETARSLVPYITPASSENSGVVTEAIIELTNHVRAENGVPGLTADHSLMEAAQRHSQEMAAANNMAHTLPGSALPSLTDRAAAVQYRYASLGENIAYNQADASSVVASWMNSPPHRQNMLSTTFTDIGVGLARNFRGEPYYTMMLGDRA